MYQNLRIHHYWRMMKVIFILMTVALVQVSAATRAQHLTVVHPNISLKEFFREVQQQTGFVVLYHSGTIERIPPFEVRLENQPLVSALHAVLDGKRLAYTIREKEIVIKEAPLILAYPIVKGRIIDSLGHGLDGASVRVINAEGKRTSMQTKTDSDGYFELKNVPEGYQLELSYIGHVSTTVMAASDVGVMVLKAIQSELEEVEVMVNTGYQQLPKERATGSFEHVDNDLLNRSVSSDFVSRLADVTPGLVINKNGVIRRTSQTPISIRGQSTIFAREDPLIILDNFPFTGDVSSINPNDIESITILKDAAAASIWGAQSANGVIVINTKKGTLNQPTQVSFNSNLTVSAKPDIFYLPQITTSEFIDIEELLFKRGYYNSIRTDNAKTALTPVVELLFALRDGMIDSATMVRGIDAFRHIDVRNEIDNYFRRNAVNQQYAFNLKGGNSNQRFFLSAGHDRELSTNVGERFSRTTLNANNTYSMLNGRLEFSSMIYFAASTNTQNQIEPSHMQTSPGKPLFPYARFTNESGELQPVIHTYRTSFLEQAAADGLLDWSYNPVIDQRLYDKGTNLTDYRVNVSGSYKILAGLSASLRYQYVNSARDYSERQDKNGWYVRDMVNRFSIPQADGSILRPVPWGDILTDSKQRSISHDARAQLDYRGDFANGGNLTVLAGAEIRELATDGASSMRYGYDHQMATSVVVDHLSNFRSYVNPISTTNRILTSNGLSSMSDRYISYFSNAAYTHLGRYIVSASVRYDQSNLFGVKANQKGVPLYSVGVRWRIDQEPFYQLAWLPFLTIRATYGYNGNIDKTLSAYTTAQYQPANFSAANLPYASIVNPPNPMLRWERVNMVNLATEFKTRNDVISGTIEFFHKKGLDLIGQAPLAPQTGMTVFRGNTAHNSGRGFDIRLTTKNLDRDVKWTSDFFISYAADKVTKYLVEPTNVAGAYVAGGTPVPAQGKPIYSVYSFRWAGLDHQTGDPLGYLDQTPSNNYSAIRASTRYEDINYHGRLRPLMFGAFRNSVAVGQLAASINISYRLGYHYRNPSLNYGTILTGMGGHSDYSKRWQNPGDEKFTHVPSIPATNISLRNEFYTYAAVHVKRGDHIRLQDINLSYTFPKVNARVYLYANNLGIIWKATKGGLDPDALTVAPAPRTIAAGVQIGF